MVVIKHDNTAFFDIDETLITYNVSPHEAHHAVTIQISADHPMVSVMPHKLHIERLVHHKAWGNGVVVWSRSGHAWAEAVIKALGLEKYVDACISKPSYFYDDRKCCDILGEHRYLKE